jgi:hypothetical protein
MFKKAGAVRYAFTAPFLDYTNSMKDQFYLYVNICLCRLFCMYTPFARAFPITPNANTYQPGTYIHVFVRSILRSSSSSFSLRSLSLSLSLSKVFVVIFPAYLFRFIPGRILACSCVGAQAPC